LIQDWKDGTMKNMQEFIQKNAWNLLVTGGAIVIAFATLSSRVNAIENDHTELENRLIKIENLTERLVVLEERDRNITEDISEIKSDIRSIKTHFEIKP